GPEHRPALGAGSVEGSEELLARTARRQVRVVLDRQIASAERLGPMLRSLHLAALGPAPKFDIELSGRLNIFTGDNGLGKSFILDVAWWALTGTWAGLPAWPRRGDDVRPRIEFQVIGSDGRSLLRTSSRFNFP